MTKIKELGQSKFLNLTDEDRMKFKKLLTEVITALTTLVAAADESTNDIVALLKIVENFRYKFLALPEMK
jgi:hypothetical protein